MSRISFAQPKKHHSDWLIVAPPHTSLVGSIFKYQCRYTHDYSHRATDSSVGNRNHIH